MDNETIDYAVDQFMKSWKVRTSTTFAREYINKLLPDERKEVNKRIKERCRTDSRNMISNQSYR